MEAEVIRHVALRAVCVSLIESQVEKRDDQPAAEHGAVGALDEPDAPHDKGQHERRKRNVPVRELAHGGTIDDVVGHHLLDGHANAGQEARHAVDVHLEKQPRVERHHVEKVIEEGRGHRDADVDDEKEDDGFDDAPKRLQRLAHE